MEVVLIRHTPCDVPSGVCYGHLDVGLRASSPEDIAATLRSTPQVAAVFSSSSARCLLLAQALAQRDGCTLTIDDDLRELNFGAWEGLTWDAIPRVTSDPWTDDPWLRSPPNGESESQLSTRIERAFRLIANCGAARVAIVSHGGALRLLRCLILGLPLAERWNWQPRYGETRCFTVQPESTCRFSDP